MKQLTKKENNNSCFSACTIFFTGSAFKNDFFEIAKQIEIFTTLV